MAVAWCVSPPASPARAGAMRPASPHDWRGVLPIRAGLAHVLPAATSSLVPYLPLGTSGRLTRALTHRSCNQLGGRLSVRMRFGPTRPPHTPNVLLPLAWADRPGPPISSHLPPGGNKEIHPSGCGETSWGSEAQEAGDGSGRPGRRALRHALGRGGPSGARRSRPTRSSFRQNPL